ncbi:MAG: hypothetical protein KC422_01455 [Trueperaceae bacterium]|nr:hypothetical protein [Trueperaceae bacterium]
MSDLRDFTISELSRAYRNKDVSPVEVTRAYLDKLEPGKIYRSLSPERALNQAKEAEKRFQKGISLGPLQGVPLALKDLIDTEAEVTAAGSKVLAEKPAAKEDAPIAARLDAVGAVFLGKTTMTELAFSGLGLNPHFGTPGNALDETLIPGGSSSGSGVAVASHLACAALGSDTGGSVRIPSSFNGIVGLKTSNGSIPKDGTTPLSTTLDTLGPMTRSVEDAWLLWRAMAAKSVKPFEVELAKKLRLLVPENIILDRADEEVKTAFHRALEFYEGLGHDVIHKSLPELSEIPALYNQYGSFASHESLALYEDMLESRGDDIDPRVAKRILEFRGRPSTDYLRLSFAQQAMSRSFWEAYRSFDAVLAPTVAILPRKIRDLEQNDQLYFETNGLVLRNTMLFNFLAGPATSVPCGTTATGLSVGLMVATAPHTEAHSLAIASLVENKL